MKFLAFHKTKTNLMPRFYVPYIESEQIELSELDSKHAIRVLRLKKGDDITIMDGKGILAEGVIIDDHVKKTKVNINKSFATLACSLLCLSLFVNLVSFGESSFL